MSASRSSRHPRSLAVIGEDDDEMRFLVGTDGLGQSDQCEAMVRREIFSTSTVRFHLNGKLSDTPTGRAIASYFGMLQVGWARECVTKELVLEMSVLRLDWTTGSISFVRLSLDSQPAICF